MDGTSNASSAPNITRQSQNETPKVRKEREIDRETCGPELWRQVVPCGWTTPGDICWRLAQLRRTRLHGETLANDISPSRSNAVA